MNSRHGNGIHWKIAPRRLETVWSVLFQTHKHTTFYSPITWCFDAIYSPAVTWHWQMGWTFFTRNEQANKDRKKKTKKFAQSCSLADVVLLSADGLFYRRVQTNCRCKMLCYTLIYIVIQKQVWNVESSETLYRRTLMSAYYSPKPTLKPPLIVLTVYCCSCDTAVHGQQINGTHSCNKATKSHGPRLALPIAANTIAYLLWSWYKLPPTATLAVALNLPRFPFYSWRANGTSAEHIHILYVWYSIFIHHLHSIEVCDTLQLLTINISIRI